MFEHIRADAMRALRLAKPPGFLQFLQALVRNYGLQALIVYRFGRWLNGARDQSFKWLRFPLYPLYWLLAAGVRKAYDIHLEQSADIGPGLYIGHFGGIRVKNCRIGPQCAIQQQVKLLPSENSAAGPAVAGGVWIGAHAQICGNVAVGAGATVGAGAVVIQDIPERCLVLGNPARVAKRDYDNQAFL